MKIFLTQWKNWVLKDYLAVSYRKIVIYQKQFGEGYEASIDLNENLLRDYDHFEFEVVVEQVKSRYNFQALKFRS